MKINNKILVLYYLVLLFVMLSWTNTTEAPNIIIRSGFLLAVVIPSLISEKCFLAPVIICFLSISQNGFAHSYMPDTLIYYVIILLLGIIVAKPVKNYFKVPSYLWITFLYVIMINLVTGFAIERISYTFIIAILLLFFTSNQSKKDINLWSFCFVLASLVLSILFIFNRDKFAMDYHGIGLEQTTWMDPNYFGVVIGMGGVIALLDLVDRNDDVENATKPLYIKIVYIVTIVLSLFTLVLNASRGALLATGMALVLTIMSTKGNLYGKIVLTITIIISLVYIYRNSFFDFLMYRLENEDVEGANGRYIIWERKIDSFFNGNFFSIIFGNGYQGGLSLGYTNKIGTHNDFVGFLVEYGIIGLFLFLQMIIKPVFHVIKNKENVTKVLVLMLFLSICCFTIEPITGAYIPNLFFYFYIVLVAYSRKREASI